MFWRRLTLSLVGGLMSCGPKNLLPPPTLALAPEVAATSFTLGEPAPVAADAPSPWQWLNEWGGRRLLSDYPLDAITRRVDAKARIGCDPGALQSYRGTSVAYAGQVLVDPAFVERLTRFEALVNEVALEVYGRAPSKLLHAGAYACRTSRNRATRLSEHALGNALDVTGFSFKGVTKAQRAATPKPAQSAFRVTVGQHWNAERSEAGRLHRRFLRTLADRVVSANVFRVALGPSHPGHADHLHFDMSPWHYTHL